MENQHKHNRIIFNSSPVINLTKIRRIDLIKNLYGKIYIPHAVYEELITDASDKKYIEDIKGFIEEKIIEVKEVKNTSLVKALKKDLDTGESEAIALALEMEGYLIVIDENEARKIAEIYGLNKTGFIGMLVKAKKEGYIPSVMECLDLAIDEGFWIHQKLYKEILEILKEI